MSWFKRRPKAPIHEHIWEPWELYKEVEIYSSDRSKYPTHRDFIQKRTCMGCQLVELKKDQY